MKKDIKTKPKGAPPKIREAVSNLPKDAKAVMREELATKAENLKPEFKDKSQENATDYATEQLEGGMRHGTEKAAKGVNQARNYAVKKFRERQAAKAEQKAVQAAEQTVESEAPRTPIKQQNVAMSKTKETVQDRNSAPPIKSNAVQADNPKAAYIRQKQADKIKAKTELTQASDVPIKTKAEYLSSHEKPMVTTADATPKTLTITPKEKAAAIRTKDDNQVAQFSQNSPFPKTQAKEYVMKKREKAAEIERLQETQVSASEKASDFVSVPPNGDNRIKTKEQYRISQNNGNPQEPIKTKENTMRLIRSRETEKGQSYPVSNTKLSVQEPQPIEKSVKDRRIKQHTTIKGTIKVKDSVAGTETNRKAKQARVIKTSKRTLKKANLARTAQKKAVKQAQRKAAKKAAQESAKRAAQAAKTAARVIKIAAVKAAQLIATAAKAVVSAIAALGGWAVLLILLIIVIIVAAIAASPFGIFISDEAADVDSIPISAIVAECNLELSGQLDGIENANAHDRIVMEGEQANWDEIIAIFAVKTAGTGDETAQDVVVIDEAKKQKLKDIFWDMNSITARTETATNGDTTETVLYITINAKTKEDMIAQYGFTEKQQEALATLLENNDVLISAAQSLAISDATAKGVIDALPENLPQKRKAVIKAACSLVGKVNYFWGGKSSAIGWDSQWGKMALVTAGGSRSSGTMRPFGLDCSGFVTWSFINAGMSANAIGHGTQGQIANCTRIAWSAAQPGDLAFLSDLSHVGIVAGKDASGNILVIHCSSGANNVVITTNSIFGFAARPRCY